MGYEKSLIINLHVNIFKSNYQWIKKVKEERSDLKKDGERVEESNLPRDGQPPLQSALKAVVHTRVTYPPQKENNFNLSLL